MIRDVFFPKKPRRKKEKINYHTLGIVGMCLALFKYTTLQEPLAVNLPGAINNICQPINKLVQHFSTNK